MTTDSPDLTPEVLARLRDLRDKEAAMRGDIDRRVEWRWVRLTLVTDLLFHAPALIAAAERDLARKGECCLDHITSYYAGTTGTGAAKYAWRCTRDHAATQDAAQIYAVCPVCKREPCAYWQQFTREHLPTDAQRVDTDEATEAGT